MISFILYLAAHGPNYIFVILYSLLSILGRIYLSAVKSIMRYFTCTRQIGLRYPKRVDYDLVGYTNSNFSVCRLDKKSTNITCYLLGTHLSPNIVRNKQVSCHPQLRLFVALRLYGGITNLVITVLILKLSELDVTTLAL